ncbi:MAG: hypothetical protein U1E05_26985 [Patescibacteria group bacterium]|nr:hypothetical protein [Patescibacteria group bacterium]
MTSIQRLLAAAGAASLLAVAGCGGGSTSASGDITYDGRPVERGAITFLPADGRGPAAGAEIRDGRYQADDLIAGTKVVQIEAFNDIPYARSSEEAAQQAEAASRGRAAGAPAAKTATISANAEGNNATVEVNAGKQVLDFHLKPPTRNH